MKREKSSSDSELLHGIQKYMNYGTNSIGLDRPVDSRLTLTSTSSDSFSFERVSSETNSRIQSPTKRICSSPKLHQTSSITSDPKRYHSDSATVYRFRLLSKTSKDSKQDVPDTPTNSQSTKNTLTATETIQRNIYYDENIGERESMKQKPNVSFKEDSLGYEYASIYDLPVPTNQKLGQNSSIQKDPDDKRFLSESTKKSNQYSLLPNVTGEDRINIEANQTQYGSLPKDEDQDHIHEPTTRKGQYSLLPQDEPNVNLQNETNNGANRLPPISQEPNKFDTINKVPSNQGSATGTSQYNADHSSISSAPNVCPSKRERNGDGDEPECPCTIDCLLNNSIGPWGAWQMRISLLASLLKFPIAWFQLGIVFLAPATDFWCARPPQGAIPSLDSIPVDEWRSMINYNGTGRHHTPCLLHGSCYMKDPRGPNSNPPVPCLWGYEFDKSVHHSTIITEWEMVCHRAKMIDLSQAVLMFGILLGTVILGITSDRVGRKPVLMTCLLIQTLAGVLSSLAPTYSLFLLTRFIMAFANAGTMVCSFVMCMEVVGGKWRTIVPVLYQIPFGVGNTIMALVAYFIRDWRMFQLTLSLFSAFYWTYWWFMPESPRWLLATGRHERAMKLLKEIARENEKTAEEIERSMRCVPAIIPLNSSNTKLSMKDLFNTPVILIKTCILCLHWFFAGISFYGFSQYMGQITNHLYAMVAIGGLISLPGTFLCCYIIQRFGRRETISGAHIFTAACFLGILLIPQGKHFADWPRVMFAACGVVGLSVSTPALYLFSGELFPTVLRNAGMGVVMMCSRVGSMIAPFVTSLSTMSNWLPLFILSVCVFLEAILVIPLPETKDTALPDTVADAEAFTSKNTTLPRCFDVFTINENRK